MNYSTFSLKQLKAHTLENNIFVTGDKRTKQAYIDSIHHHQMHRNIEAESVDVIAPIESAETVEVVETIEVVDPIASEPVPSDNPKISSVVALQPFAFILAAVIIGVIYLTIGIILNTVTIIKRSIPVLSEIINKLPNHYISKDTNNPKKNYQYILE